MFKINQLLLIFVVYCLNESAANLNLCSANCECNSIYLKCSVTSHINRSIICPRQNLFRSVILDFSNSLSGNRLDKLFDKCSLQSVTVLAIINSGSLTAITNDFFYEFQSLKTLTILGPGYIEHLPNNFLNDLPELILIRIDGQNIRELNKGLFSICHKLLQLHIIRSQLQFLNDSPFQSCFDLKILDLNNNYLNIIHKSAFRGLTNVLKLDLSHNHIDNILPLIFSDLKRLETLDLSFNKLKVINAGAFHNVDNLKILNLKNNDISKISSKGFKNLLNLHFMNVENNHLDYLDEAIFKDMIKLTKIVLDNDLICIKRRKNVVLQDNLKSYLDNYRSCFVKTLPTSTKMLTSTLATTHKQESRVYLMKSSKLESCGQCEMRFTYTHTWVTFLAGLMTSGFVILAVVFAIYIVSMQHKIKRLKQMKSNQDALSLMTNNTRESNVYATQKSLNAEYKPVVVNNNDDNHSTSNNQELVV